jgi:hypothetical protein
VPTSSEFAAIFADLHRQTISPAALKNTSQSIVALSGRRSEQISFFPSASIQAKFASVRRIAIEPTQRVQCMHNRFINNLAILQFTGSLTQERAARKPRQLSNQLAAMMELTVNNSAMNLDSNLVFWSTSIGSCDGFRISPGANTIARLSRTKQQSACEHGNQRGSLTCLSSSW